MPAKPPDPVAQAIASISRTVALWRLGGLSPLELCRKVLRGYRQNHFDARCAQFAYYSMLALFPLLILLIAGVARLPLRGVLENSLEAADRGLPEEVFQLLDRQVREIQAHSTVSLMLASLLILGVAGSRVFLTMTEGLNLAYGVHETRRFWQVYGMAFLLTVGASLLLFVAMVLMVVGPMVSNWAAELQLDLPWLAVVVRRGTRWGVVCTCLWLYTATVYCLVPNVKLPWYWLSPGSVFAVMGWMVVSQGFRLYVENLGQFNETYGALGGVMVLLIWLHLTGAVLLMGGQINGVIHRAAARVTDSQAGRDARA
jgi:membrane protein